MSRALDLGGRGPAAPAAPLTTGVAAAAVLFVLLLPVAIRRAAAVYLIGLPVVLLVLVLVGTALGVGRRDGLAAAALLGLAAIPWLLLFFFLIAAAERWSAPYIAAATLAAAVLLLPLPVEIRAQHARAVPA